VNFPGIVKPEAIQCRRSVEMSHSNSVLQGNNRTIPQTE
jgi:hypothetical protein